MKEDDETFLNLLNPAPRPGADGTDPELTLDALGIPILEELADQAIPVQPAATPAGQGASGVNHELPDYDTLLTTMREYIKSQLEDDLSHLTGQVVPAVVASAARDLEARMEAELKRLLEEKIAQLLERSLDRQLGRQGPGAG